MGLGIRGAGGGETESGLFGVESPASGDRIDVGRIDGTVRGLGVEAVLVWVSNESGTPGVEAIPVGNLDDVLASRIIGAIG